MCGGHWIIEFESFETCVDAAVFFQQSGLKPKIDNKLATPPAANHHLKVFPPIWKEVSSIDGTLCELMHPFVIKAINSYVANLTLFTVGTQPEKVIYHESKPCVKDVFN